MSRATTELDGAYCPLPQPQRLALWLRRGKYIYTALGLERLCPKCKELWPADTEFFFSVPSQPGGLNEWCKACYRDWRDARNLKRRAA
jgi:hypothetical protein